MIEITEETVTEQSKVVLNLGRELHILEQQGSQSYQDQLDRMQKVVLMRIKSAEETAVLNGMINVLAEARANVRIEAMRLGGAASGEDSSQDS